MEGERKRIGIVAKRLGVFLGTLFILFFVFKFAVYFMPFLIAGIIALCIEPIIKFCMNRLKLSRRVSSIIVITLTIIGIITLVIWGSIFAVDKLIEFSKNISPLITEISTTFETELEDVSVKLEQYVPREVIDTITNSITGFVSNAGVYIKNLLGNILKIVLSVPTIILNVVITILALIFFTKDKIYIIDMIEHHFPKKWIRNASDVIRGIFSTIGSYLKVYSKLLLLTFTELFLAFSILRAIGFPLENLLLLSLSIAIVDILPVLGVGTVLIPWAIWQFITGDISFGIALTILYLITLTVRQTIEPKLVSKQLGVHPIITLFAMYAGFKVFGFIGLIFGPIILMVLRGIFAKPLEKGLFKDLFDEK